MSRRQTPRFRNTPLPRIWLMTDPRFGDDLLPAIRRLPSRSGVIFRHYEMATDARLALVRQVQRICRQRGHLFLLAGDERTARAWHADGYHSREEGRQSKRSIQSAAVHDRTELASALRVGADLVLISPVFATASHPDTRPLGRFTFTALAKQAGGIAVIALGGMTARKAATLSNGISHGWAAIDAFRN